MMARPISPICDFFILSFQIIIIRFFLAVGEFFVFFHDDFHGFAIVFYHVQAFHFFRADVAAFQRIFFHPFYQIFPLVADQNNGNRIDVADLDELPGVKKFQTTADAAGHDHDNAGESHEIVQTIGKFAEVFFDVEVFVVVLFFGEFDGQADGIGAIFFVAGFVSGAAGIHQARATAGDNIEVVLAKIFGEVEDIFVDFVCGFNARGTKNRHAKIMPFYFVAKSVVIVIFHEDFKLLSVASLTKNRQKR